jgi:hypothetical protein
MGNDAGDVTQRLRGTTLLSRRNRGRGDQEHDDYNGSDRSEQSSALFCAE